MQSITISNFWLIEDSPIMRAVCSIVIDKQLAIHDIKLVETSPGCMVVSMPSQPDGRGRRRDVVHPINRDLRQHIDELLIGEYQRLTQAR